MLRFVEHDSALRGVVSPKPIKAPDKGADLQGLVGRS